MAIPTSIRDGLISGAVGTLSHWGPMRARTAVLDSADEENNVFGRAFTFNDQTVETVQAGGDGAFAGIMVHPEAHRIADVMPNGYVGEFLDMGEIFVEVIGVTDVTIGSPVYYHEATGELTVINSARKPGILGAPAPADLTALKLIDNGTLTLALGGDPDTATAIDLSGAATMAAAAALLQTAVRTMGSGAGQYATATVTYDASTNSFNLEGSTAAAAEMQLTSTPLSVALGWDAGILLDGEPAPTAVPNASVERHLPSAETPNLVVIRLTN